MLIVLNDDDDIIDIDMLKKVGSGGKDGTVYRYGNRVVKLPTSGHMTVAKFQDLSTIDTCCSSRLILPLQKGQAIDISSPKHLIFAYTSKFIDHDSSLLEDLPTRVFLEEANCLRDEIHNHFTANEIALLDTNPNNILTAKSSEDDFTLNLIDHDRNITPSSTIKEREFVSSCGYDNFNDKKFAHIMYKLLLLEMIRNEELKEGGSLKNDHPLIIFANQEAQALSFGDMTIDFSDVEELLLGTDTVSETVDLMRRKEL